MKAVYCTAPGELELRRDEPKPTVLRGDDVIIEVAWCGICPWDVRVFNGKKSVQAFADTSFDTRREAHYISS